MQTDDLPLVIAGPILRRIQSDRLTFWLATSQPVQCSVALYPDDQPEIHLGAEYVANHLVTLKASQHCHFFMLDLPLQKPLPTDAWIGYDLLLRIEGSEQWLSVTEWAEDLVYTHHQTPGFVVRSRLDKLLHGSCRKPHHPSKDGLVRADQMLCNPQLAAKEWPTLLMMSGDQIYADDVAGPMLVAIHRLLARLNMPAERIEGISSTSFADLHGDAAGYYQRQNLLPKTAAEGPLADVLFSGVKKPIFTSDNARNHLVSLSEVLSMYLLIWSPVCWRLLTLEMPDNIPAEFQQKYQQELPLIEEFAASLPAVRRVLAHLPTAMIFDDHDVTDDWNLTLGWERTAYHHPFSKRIIGNALLGYFICQGWGNAPENFPTGLFDDVQQALQNPASEEHTKVIDDLLAFAGWHYQWPTEPAMVVLDTRTHRWRSERSANLPSGLMDWEALSDLQQSLLDKKSVIMVSPAPVFGVKLIETIQRIFTWFGKPLMVDAENWMAHSGSAYALLNLFHHSRTPQHFIILSGDVHYSFFYHIQLRGERRSPDIWQITSSGLSNEFPKSLIEIFDRLDRWLYASRSPLNWFTKRRSMKVIPHKPKTAAPGERLINASGIGLVELSAEGTPERVCQLCANGEDVEFIIDKTSARWE